MCTEQESAEITTFDITFMANCQWLTCKFCDCERKIKCRKICKIINKEWPGIAVATKENVFINSDFE